jgi:L-fuculose-phosphate aldolase
MPDRTLEKKIRQAIVEIYLALARRGMNAGSSGNISVRFGEGMLITPTGCTEETLRAADVVLANFEGGTRSRLRPSSEWAMHAEIYGRVPGANAVVHTHADACVALSCLRKPMPAFHYMIHSFGGDDVPCVPYHPFGTRALGNAAAEALARRRACLMANHGMLTTGKTMRAAFDAAVLLETLARQYLATLSAGRPILLTRAEMAVVARQFEDYGRQPRSTVRLRWSLP